MQLRHQHHKGGAIIRYNLPNDQHNLFSQHPEKDVPRQIPTHIPVQEAPSDARGYRVEREVQINPIPSNEQSLLKVHQINFPINQNEQPVHRGEQNAGRADLALLEPKMTLYNHDTRLTPYITDSGILSRPGLGLLRHPPLLATAGLWSPRTVIILEHRLD